MVLWKFDSLPEKLIIFKVMKMRLWKAAGVPLMVVSAALSGVMAVSCKSEVDGPEVEHICNFGDGDLSRAIPAEGGNVVLFDGNDVSSGKYYDWCYAIDLPLDVIDNSDEGGFALLSKELSGENKKLRRVQFEDYRFGNFIDGGNLPDPGCELYFFKDAYSGDAESGYAWMHYLPLYTGKDMSHYADVPGWGVLRFYGNGSASIEALPNDTGKERVLSLVYDMMIPGEKVLSDSVELRQPAVPAR